MDNHHGDVVCLGFTLRGIIGGHDTYLKICKRCFRKFEESEVDVVGVSSATELAVCLDSRFHGNDKEGCTGMTKRDAGMTEGILIGVDDINDFCTQCREELGVMDLPGFGL